MTKRKTGRALIALLAALCLLLVSCTGTGEPTDPVQSSDPEISQAEASAPADADAGEQAVEEGVVYVYLTRHGQTITNTTRRMVSGRGNTPLTEAGREVAYALGVGLSDLPFAAVYTSTMHRTYETAQIILAESHTAARDLPIHQVHNLREVDVGSFEGMTYAELAADYGMDFSPGIAMADFVGQFHELDPTGEAESYEDFQKRVYDSFLAICEEQAARGGGNVLVVAHGAVNTSIATIINDDGVVLAEPENSSVILIEYDHGALRVLSYSDMSYIETAQEKMENPEPVELHLVVTGQTQAEEAGRVNNIFDSALTEAGIASARQAGQGIGSLHAVYASDQWKDLDTARYLIEGSASPDLDPHADGSLRGVFLGNFECDLAERLPEVEGETPSAREQLAVYAAEDEMVEGYDEAAARLSATVREIAETSYREGGGSVAVVSSGLAQQLVAEELTGEAVGPLQNGEVVTLIYDGTGYALAK